MGYTPLVPAVNYNMDRQSIAVNGKMLPIDPTIFRTSHDQGTLVDSGIVLTYMLKEAYDAFVHAINLVISKSTNLSALAGNVYYAVSNSTSSAKVFPLISLHFAGGASMFLEPEKYFL
ncbi:hypothetical protein ACFX1Q_001904 [Malus domestica]